MASRAPEPFKLEVRFESREDGGLRAYCEKVPGFLLSHADPDKVLADVKPALEIILSEMFGVPMTVERLRDLDEVTHQQMSIPGHLTGSQSYVGLSHAH
jgi:hypothetical protein